MRTLTAVILAVTLTGCATGVRLSMPEVPSERAASLTLIRNSIMGFCCTIPIYVDDYKAAELAVRTYATVVVPAGERVVSWQHPSGLRTVRVTPAPGDHLYVVMDLAFFQDSLQLYPAALAREMIGGMRRVE